METHKMFALTLVVCFGVVNSNPLTNGDQEQLQRISNGELLKYLLDN